MALDSNTCLHRILLTWTLILLCGPTLAEENSIFDGATVKNSDEFNAQYTPDANLLIGVGFKTLCILPPIARLDAEGT